MRILNKIRERLEAAKQQDQVTAMVVADAKEWTELLGLVVTDELPPYVVEVLALTPIHTVPIAQGLREVGIMIPPQPPIEHATVLWWLLKRAMAHGANWRGAMADEMNLLISQHKAQRGKLDA